MNETNASNSADTAANETSVEKQTNSDSSEAISHETVNMSGIKPPKNFVINSELDMSQEWTEWLELYENYFIAAKITKEEVEVQTANFLTAAGRDVLKVLNNLNISAEEKKVIKTVKEKLTAHFAPSKNKTYERCQFHRLKQQPSEKFEDFLQKLKTQVKRCVYEAASQDEFVMDQVVLGVFAGAVQTKIMD